MFRPSSTSPALVPIHRQHPASASDQSVSTLASAPSSCRSPRGRPPCPRASTRPAGKRTARSYSPRTGGWSLPPRSRRENKKKISLSFLMKILFSGKYFGSENWGRNIFEEIFSITICILPCGASGFQSGQTDFHVYNYKNKVKNQSTGKNHIFTREK